MDPTCGLAHKFRDLVFDLIWEQFRYLICHGQNIEQLNERLEELTLKRISIQHQVDEAINNANEIEDEVLKWLDDVNGISQKREELHKQSQAKTECSIISCPSPWIRYKLSKRAKEMAQEVADIRGKGNFDRVSYRVPPQSMQKLTNTETNEGIKSRAAIKDQIMEALRNPSVNMIGLCGPGGVGKTTIVEEVENNQNIFEKVIVAIVSEELDIKKIQCQIAEKLGMQLNEQTEDVRASRLCKRLKKEKNMLLVLDDLWKELDLGKVGIPFLDFNNSSKKNEGCKILLTSRNETLLSNHMQCQKLIKVDVLSENEAWEFFKRIAELSIDSSSLELISLATEIVRKCGGLPLAIATIAKTLRNRDMNEWKDALVRLKKFSRNITGIKEVDAVLKLSYNHLSSENKLIFLLAAMLSHDPSIDDLLMYSVGLDFLEDIENMEDAHVRISAIISKLKSLNLFLNSFSSCHFTMHDIFREVALSIAFDELHAFIVRHRKLTKWPDRSMLEGYKGICLQESDINELPEELHGLRLEFFLLNSTKKLDLTIPIMFFKYSKELKVLAFTNVHFSLLPSLRFLQKLKVLCLQSCLLEDITEVGRLKNLKVLSLTYSEIQRLPIELIELTSLQMLNLAHCFQLKVIPQKLLSSLKKLEVVSMENSFDQWKVERSIEANENASLEELKDLPISSLDIHIPDISSLPDNLFLDMNLKRYKIFIGKHWKWEGRYETSKILKLELESGVHLKRGVRKLLEGVEDLHLYGSNDGLENVLYSQDGRGFPHLRRLHIESNENVPNKIFQSLFNKVLLLKLEKLELSNLNRLIPLIWDDEISRNSFSNLKTLSVHWCEGFVKLVSLHVLKSLNNLEELEVIGCDMLEVVFDFEDLNDYKEMKPSSVVVPLKKLLLCNLPRLKTVWSNHYQGNVLFSNLKEVTVGGCENLTSLFPASIAKGMLCDLEELNIIECGIDVIAAKDQVSESAVIAFEFPKLTNLILFNLPNLRNFYPQKCTFQWPHLQQLCIESCDELVIFEKEVSSSSEIHEEDGTLESKYPLLSHKVITNLKELGLGGKEAEMIGSGQFSMYHFPQVKVLSLYPQKEKSISYISLLKSFPNLEELKLEGELFKEAFGENDDVSAFAAPFSKLTLSRISNMISMGSLFVSSPNLTSLEVTSPHNLTTLMTSSTARSFVHLTSLSIYYCPEMEGIITKQEGEDDEGKEILFSKLEILELHCLPRLKRFCGHNYTFIFPLLERVTIRECHQLSIFSPGVIHAPRLQSVRVVDSDGLLHKDIWMSDLNNTIQHRFTIHEVVSKTRCMALNAKNITMITDVYPEVNTLYVEGFQDEGVTFPYSSFERFPKLERLYVEHCFFEEIFLSHDGSLLPPMHQKLTYLEITSCDKLVKLAPSSSASFQNLKFMHINGCHQLIHLVTTSTAKSLVSLRWLDINDCKVMEEVVTNDTNEDVQGAIAFNGLWWIGFTDMPRLKMFSSQCCTFEFPKLKKIEISGCPQMKMFCFGVVETPNLSKMKIEEHQIKGNDIAGDLNKTIETLSSAQDSVNT